MATTAQYLQQLSQDLTNLKQAASASGIEVSQNDTFTTLATKFAGAGGGSINTYIDENISEGLSTSYGTLSGWALSLKEYRKTQKINSAKASYMFYEFPFKKTPRLTNTSIITNAQYMFNRNYYLEEIDLTDFDASNITHANGMFAANPKLTKLDLSNVRFEKLVSANEMFSQCSALTSIDLSGFVSPNVTSYSSMFSSCSSLTNVDCSNLKFTENAVSVGIERMFMSCSSLTSIDIRNLKTDKASSTMYMFYGCKKLQHIDMRGLDLTKVTNYNSMFGTSSSNNVPSDCEIIVKDDDSKAWLNSKFSRLTNVKTVAEYEAE